MLDGFYSVKFQTPYGFGGGVILLDAGSVKGGDSTMYYHGTYKVEDDRFTAALKTNTHLEIPGQSSVFGVPKAELKISATVAGNAITGIGVSPQAPGIEMQFTMTRLET